MDSTHCAVRICVSLCDRSFFFNSSLALFSLSFDLFFFYFERSFCHLLSLCRCLISDFRRFFFLFHSKFYQIQFNANVEKIPWFFFASIIIFILLFATTRASFFRLIYLISTTRFSTMICSNSHDFGMRFCKIYIWFFFSATNFLCMCFHTNWYTHCG